jgi:hypothetical protein
VGRWRFAEERRAERKCLSAKVLLRDCQQPYILSHGRDGWQSHRMAQAMPCCVANLLGSTLRVARQHLLAPGFPELSQNLVPESAPANSTISSAAGLRILFF